MRSSHAGCRLTLAGAALALALAGTSAQAQVGEDTSGVRPLALSISGAMSGGSYQAGVNWVVLELARRARADAPGFGGAYGIPRFALRSITGASAGNINTLLWAVEWCTRTQGEDGRYRVTPPDSSLFARVWTRIDISEMLRPPPEGARPEYGLLSLARVRGLTDPPVLERINDPRLARGCSVPVGITFTRIQPGSLRLQEKLEIETQRFATVFDATVRDPAPLTGQRMRFRPMFASDAAYRDPRFGKLVQLSPYPGEITPLRILNAVQASSAFPLLFRPVDLAVRYPDSGADSTDLFVDGGVFDNNPLSLALNIYRVRHVSPGDTARLEVVYINPDNLRPPVSRTRKEAARSVPAGGLGAVLAMLDGAVGTARQYELQLIAREQEADSARRTLLALSAERARLLARTRELTDRLRELGMRLPRGDARAAGLLAALDSLRVRADTLSRRDSAEARLLAPPGPEPGASEPAGDLRLPSMLPSFALHLSTRSFPLYSDRLVAAAAFLGRPLRQFDFWVGAYDGLHLAARDFTCARAGAAENDCVADTLAVLIQDTLLFDEPGRSVLAALYDNEFRDDVPTLARAVAASGFSRRRLEADTIAAQERLVLLALFRAIDHETRPDAAPPCRARTILGAALCGSGLTPLLEHLRSDSTRAEIGGGSFTARDVIGRWASVCRPDDERHAADCRAHPRFVALVDDPEAQVAAITDQLLVQLDRVEHQLDAHSPPGRSWTPMTTAGLWLYEFGNVAHLPRSQFFTGAAPRGVGAWYRYLPYHMGGMIGADGVDLRYRPTVYVGDRQAITFPLLAFVSTYWQETGGKELFLGGGLGYARRTRLPLLVALSEYGIETHAYGGIEHHRWGTSAGAEVEPYVITLAGALRLGIRIPVYQLDDRGRIPGGLSIGIEDIGSLIFWLTHK